MQCKTIHTFRGHLVVKKIESTIPLCNHYAVKFKCFPECYTATIWSITVFAQKGIL